MQHKSIAILCAALVAVGCMSSPLSVSAFTEYSSSRIPGFNDFWEYAQSQITIHQYFFAVSHRLDYRSDWSPCYSFSVISGSSYYVQDGVVFFSGDVSFLTVEADSYDVSSGTFVFKTVTTAPSSDYLFTWSLDSEGNVYFNLGSVSSSTAGYRHVYIGRFNTGGLNSTMRTAVWRIPDMPPLSIPDDSPAAEAKDDMISVPSNVTDVVDYVNGGTGVAPDSGGGSSFSLPDSWMNGGQTLDSGTAEDVGIDVDEAFDAFDEMNFDDYTSSESYISAYGFFWALFVKIVNALDFWPFILLCLSLMLLSWFLGR